MHTVYKIGERDRGAIDEFDATPIGHHSPALQRVLNVIRGQPVEGKYVLVCTKPHKEWQLAQLTGERGKPARMLKGVVFGDLETAEREVFRRCWKQQTGAGLETAKGSAT